MSGQTFLSFITNSSFLNQHFNIDQITKLSYIDNLLIQSSTYNKTSMSESLYIAFSEDIILKTTTSYLPMSPLLQSEYQDSLNTMVLVAPELSMVLNDFEYYYIMPSTFNNVPVAVFDSYMSNLVYFPGVGVTYFMFFGLYVWLLVYSLIITLPLS
jgi:hypothetical protein